MVDLGSLVLLMSIFGTKVAVLYVILGLVIAIISGTIIEKMHMAKYVEEFILNANSVDIDCPTLTQKERLIYAKDQVVKTFKKVFPDSAKASPALNHSNSQPISCALPSAVSTSSEIS